MQTNSSTGGSNPALNKRVFNRLAALAQDPVFRWLLAHPQQRSRSLLRLIINAVLSVVFDLGEPTVIEGHRLVAACVVPDGTKLGRTLCRRLYVDALREFVEMRRQKAPLAINRLDPTYDEFEANGVPRAACQAGRDTAETPRLRLGHLGAGDAGEAVLDDDLDDRLFFHATAGDWYIIRSGGRVSGPYKTDPLNQLLAHLGLHKKAALAVRDRAREVEALMPVFESPREFLVNRGVPMLNTYKPPRLDPIPGPWPDVYAVLRNLCNGDRRGVEFVLDWLARFVQPLRRRRRPFGHPVLNGSMLVFHGIEGSGKDTLRRIMSLILGEDNVALMGQEDLESKFHAQFDGALMLFADEVVSSSNRGKQTENFIKKLINEKIPVEEKHETARLVGNTMNVIFTSNDDVPVTISRSDRRFTVFHTGPKLPSGLSDRIYKDLHGAQEQVAAFLDHLLRRRVSLRFGELLATKAKDDIKRDSAPSDEKFAMAVIEEGWLAVSAPWCDAAIKDYPRQPVWLTNDPRNLVIADIAREIYRDYCQRAGLRPVGDKKLTRTLKKMIPGLESTPMDVGGIKRRVYVGLPMDPPGDQPARPALRVVGKDETFQQDHDDGDFGDAPDLVKR